MTSVRLDGLGKRFENTVALDNVSLTIEAGELFFLLGPSGCGKSTLLRMIAGLMTPSTGRIFFNDRDVTSLPTAKRNAVMCFQGYALWPHLTVRQNISFGLEMRNWPRDRREHRVQEVIKLVRLDGLGDRKPNALSGGQQQRVALARALAVEPDCLLLDEPLSNLDAQLRLEMRGEIRRICKTAGFTTIYVTHDQREALSVADRVAVLKGGRLEQVGKPQELYLRPRNSFVASFMGQTNLLSGTVIGRDGPWTRVSTGMGELSAASNGDLPEKVMVSLRPEQLRIVPGGEGKRAGANRFEADIIESTFLGEASEHLLKIGSENLKWICAPPLIDAPSRCVVEAAADDVVLLGE